MTVFRSRKRPKITFIDRWLYSLWKHPHIRHDCVTALRRLAFLTSWLSDISRYLHSLATYFETGSTTRAYGVAIRPDMRNIKFHCLERELKRRKSLSIDPTTGDKRLCSDQSQSPLFATLPPEIRMQIYIHVFEPSTPVHIQPPSLEGFIGVSPCRSKTVDETETFEHLDCRAGAGTNGKASAPLPLLLTCRRIYVESINLLYSAKTFDFEFNTCFTTFLQSIPQARHAQLRYIVLYGFPNTRCLTADENYLFNLVKERLETLTGLRSCRIVLKQRHRAVSLVLHTLQNRISDWPHRRAFSVEVVQHEKVEDGGNPFRSFDSEGSEDIVYIDKYQLLKRWTADDEMTERDIHWYCACRGAQDESMEKFFRTCAHYITSGKWRHL